MSVKRTMLAAATTLSLVGGAATAGALAAGGAAAATRPCGLRCIDFFSRQAGSYRHPNLVLAVQRQAAKAGQPIVLSRASRLDPREDFVISFRARVQDFYKAGLVTRWLARHYPREAAYEIEYAPLGVASGLCIGTPATAVNGTPVSLQPCGVSARTVWVVDLPDSIGPRTSRPYAPLINGSQTGSPGLYLLTYPRSPRQAGMPPGQLVTRPLQRSSRHGRVENRQQWGAGYGALP
jgi:hypothetical protein